MNEEFICNNHNQIGLPVIDVNRITYGLNAWNDEQYVNEGYIIYDFEMFRDGELLEDINDGMYYMDDKWQYIEIKNGRIRQRCIFKNGRIDEKYMNEYGETNMIRSYTIYPSNNTYIIGIIPYVSNEILNDYYKFCSTMRQRAMYLKQPYIFQTTIEGKLKLLTEVRNVNFLDDTL
jgi:hypothetical protein